MAAARASLSCQVFASLLEDRLLTASLLEEGALVNQKKTKTVSTAYKKRTPGHYLCLLSSIACGGGSGVFYIHTHTHPSPSLSIPLCFMANPSHKLHDHYYYILGLARSASPSTIRSAYRKLAMIWHPDKCINEDLAAGSKLKFQEIQEAYTVLSDVQKRELYDNGLYDPDDDEEDRQGLSSLLNEISSKIAEMKATECKDSGKEQNFKEFEQLCANIFNTEYKMAHFGGYRPPTSDFKYPTTHFTYPIVHPKTTSSNNKRDFWPEGFLPSHIRGNEYLYDFLEMDRASGNTAKKMKCHVEQDDHPVDQ